MANQPSPDDEYYALIRSEVVKLREEKTALEQNCTLLEARQQHLKESVAALETQYDATKQQKLAEIEALSRKSEKLASEATGITEAIDAFITKKKILTSELATMQQATDAQVADFNGTLAGKKTELAQLSDEVALQQNMLGDVNDEINTAQLRLQEIERQVADMEADSAETVNGLTIQMSLKTTELKDLQSAIDNKQDEYEELSDKVAVAAAKIAGSLKDHQAFLEYEQTARTKLKAFEESLLKREAELEQQQQVSRRRQSVL